MGDKDYESRKVSELRELCKRRGCIWNVGKKTELIARLEYKDKQDAEREAARKGVPVVKQDAGAPVKVEDAGPVVPKDSVAKSSESPTPKVNVASPKDSSTTTTNPAAKTSTPTPKTPAHVSKSLKSDDPHVTTQEILEQRRAGQQQGPVTDITKMTLEERQKIRATRFGVQNADVEKEKMKARAERFGMSNSELDKEKVKARAERFGLDNAELEAEKKKARAARFGIQTEAEKKAARIARFGTGDTKLDKALGDKTAEKKATTGGKAATPNKKRTTNGDTYDLSAKKKARIERFGATTEADKKKMREKLFLSEGGEGSNSKLISV